MTDVRPSNGAQVNSARVVASSDRASLAILLSGRVVVASLPELEPFAEIGLDTDSVTHDIGFSAHPRRLVLMSGASLYLVDIDGPEVLGRCQLPGPGRIVAIVGDHALVLVHGVGWVVDLSKSEPRATRLSARGTVSAAGTLGGQRLIACVDGALEEWDLHAAVPLRRIRLERQVVATHVGGNDRRIWMVPQREPNRVMVVSLRSSGPPRWIELPAAVVRAVPDESGNLLATVLQDGAAFVAELGTGNVTRLAPQSIHDLAWLSGGVAACALEQSVELVRVATEPGTARDSAAEADEAETLSSAASSAQERPLDAPAPGNDDPSDASAGEPTTWQRLNAWRDRVSKSSAPPVLRTPRATPLPRDEPPSISGGWREGIASWARRAISGAAGEAPMDLGRIEELAVRLTLNIDQARAVALVYGARLSGMIETAPLHVARAVGWRWPEALGNGKLAELGILRWRAGQVYVPEIIAAVLDERPPVAGRLVGGTPSFVERGAVVAPASVALEDLAVWAVPYAGSVLVAGEGADPRDVMLEAQARGVVPLLRDVSHRGLGRGLFVVARADLAAELGLDVIASWPGRDDTSTSVS